MDKAIEACIGSARDKSVRVRLSLLLLDNGKVVFEHFHSINLMPGDDYSAARAVVEQHLAAPDSGIPWAPWPAIPDSEWSKIEAVLSILQA